MSVHPLCIPTPLDRLEGIARIIDQACVHDPEDLVFNVIDEGRTFLLGLRSLDPRRRPHDELVELAVDPRWWALGVHIRGRAHLLDHPDEPAVDVTSTFAVERGGAEVSLLRHAGVVTCDEERVEGRLPDACRRLLGLPVS